MIPLSPAGRSDCQTSASAAWTAQVCSMDRSAELSSCSFAGLVEDIRRFLEADTVTVWVAGWTHLVCCAWHPAACFLKECGMLGHASRLMCAVSNVEPAWHKHGLLELCCREVVGQGRCAALPHQHSACWPHAAAGAYCQSSKACRFAGFAPSH